MFVAPVPEFYQNFLEFMWGKYCDEEDRTPLMAARLLLEELRAFDYNDTK